MSAALSLLPLLALLAARATPAAPPATVAEHAGAPKPKGIMRVADVRPGMDVIAWTVFTGRKVEPFHGVVLGVARNFFGPRRDVVLVDFDDERVRHTGIVHGMSGSPAYIGDKVLGAVALVLSPFPKDAVAGVTPLEYMLAEGDDIPGGPPPAGGGTAPAPARGGARLMADPPNAIPATAALRPLAAPLVFSGLSPQVFARFRPDFEALGFTPVLGGGGSDPGSDLGPADLQPGAPVAAVLADGDVTLDATGTITWRDGNRIFAFGHPFLQQGRVALPMAPAEIVTTLADQTFSYKVANIGPLAGTVVFDRPTAIVGDIGPVPHLIPVHVAISREGAEIADYHYRAAENPWVTPLIVQLLVMNSIQLRWDYDEEATYRLRGSIKLKGRAPVLLQESYTVAPDFRTASPALLAADVGMTFAMLYMNSFSAVEVESIDLRYETTARGLFDRLEGVFLDPERARAGESASIRVAIRSLRGERRVVPLQVPIPIWAAGKRLALRVADSMTVRAEMSAAGNLLDRAANLDQLIDLLANRPRADRLYVQLLALAPDAILYHKRLPSLPSSVAEVLARGGGPYRRLPRALVWETTIPSEGVALGAQELVIEVRP